MDNLKNFVVNKGLEVADSINTGFITLNGKSVSGLVDSSNVLSLIDSAYVSSKSSGVDSAATTALVDSSYVQARAPAGGNDSATTIALIDSSYVQARQTKYTNADFTDSAYVTTQINSVIDAAPGALNTLNELAAALGDDANFSTTITNQIAGKLDSAATTALVDSSYVQARQTSSAGNDSATTIALIDSSYVQARQITPISSFNTISVSSQTNVVADPTVTNFATTTQAQKLTASDAASSDFFGNVVDIDGDYAVAGARGNKAVYVYYYNGTTWSEQQKIQETAFGSNFGHAVSVVGDTLLVGSNNTDGSNADGTKAYVYTRSGTTWSLQQKVDPSQALENDFFGYQKTLKLDNTDNNQFIAGSHREDETNNDEGAVYIFNRSGTTWSETQRIVPSDKATSSNFGVSVDIAGDYAIFGGNSAVYVYYKSGGTWSQQQKIANPYAAGNGHSGPTNAVNFGTDGEISINAAGDTIAVGARGQFNLPGYVFVFTRSGTTWTLQQALRSSDTANEDLFGWSVSLDGTGNSLTVGAKYSSTGGKAYIFTRTGTTWTEVKDFTASDVAANWEFGEGIGISRSNDKIIVGARQNSSSTSGTGAVYIFNPGSTAIYSDTLTLEAGTGITLTTAASTDTVTITGSAAAGNDSATTIALIDSSYVQARAPAGGNDSATTIALIDSSYVQARALASASVTSSATAPSSPSSGDMWFDTTDTSLLVYYADSDGAQWVDISGATGATGPAGPSGSPEIIKIDSDLTTTDSDQVIHSFSKSTYRTIKYTAQLENDDSSGYHAEELLLTHNGTDVAITSYAKLALDSDLGIFDAAINGSDVELRLTPTKVNTHVKLRAITITEGNATPNDINALLIPIDSDLTTTDSDQVIHSFSKSTYRTMKYVAQLKHAGSNAYHSQEILLVHNGTNIATTGYAKLLLDSSLGTFDAAINGSNVELRLTPAKTNTNVKLRAIRTTV